MDDYCWRCVHRRHYAAAAARGSPRGARSDRNQRRDADPRHAAIAGEISKTETSVDTNLINIPFEKMQVRSGGYGLLDIAFLPSGKAYAVGGGGTIFASTDNGKSWTKDKVCV